MKFVKLDAGAGPVFVNPEYVVLLGAAVDEQGRTIIGTTGVEVLGVGRIVVKHNPEEVIEKFIAEELALLQES